AGIDPGDLLLGATDAVELPKEWSVHGPHGPARGATPDGGLGCVVGWVVGCFGSWKRLARGQWYSLAPPGHAGPRPSARAEPARTSPRLAGPGRALRRGLRRRAAQRLPARRPDRPVRRFRRRE